MNKLVINTTNLLSCRFEINKFKTASKAELGRVTLGKQSLALLKHCEITLGQLEYFVKTMSRYWGTCERVVLIEACT